MTDHPMRGTTHTDTIYRRCQMWAESKMRGPNTNPIPVEMARQIAAWWQSSGPDGYALATYASTGTIIEDLEDNWIKAYELANTIQDRTALCAMREVINRTVVQTYAVTHHEYGYADDSAKPRVFLTFEEGRDALFDLVDEHIDEHEPKCYCYCYDECDRCSLQALTMSLQNDPFVRPANEPLSYSIAYPSLPNPIIYTVSTPIPMSYGDYLSQVDNQD